MSVKVRIIKIDVSTGEAKKTTDYIAEEKPLTIFLNRTRYVTIFCSPENLKELAVGHMFSERIIKSIKEIEKIEVDEDKGICRINLQPNIKVDERLKMSEHFSRIIFSACGSDTHYQPALGLRKINSDLKIKAVTLSASVSSLNFIADTFRKTGGVHVAAVFDVAGNLVTFAEDVGRHNAVDKAVGSCIMKDTKLSDCFLALSGRVTGDVVLKAVRAGFPILGSLSAALDSGVLVAKNAGLTLIGFVRGKRMNIYTCPDRILA